MDTLVVLLTYLLTYLLMHIPADVCECSERPLLLVSAALRSTRMQFDSGFRQPGNTKKLSFFGAKPVERPNKKCTKLNSISACHASNN